MKTVTKVELGETSLQRFIQEGSPFSRSSSYQVFLCLIGRTGSAMPLGNLGRGWRGWGLPSWNRPTARISWAKSGFCIQERSGVWKRKELMKSSCVCPQSPLAILGTGNKNRNFHFALQVPTVVGDQQGCVFKKTGGTSGINFLSRSACKSVLPLATLD